MLQGRRSIVGGHKLSAPTARLIRAMARRIRQSDPLSDPYVPWQLPAFSNELQVH